MSPEPNPDRDARIEKALRSAKNTDLPKATGKGPSPAQQAAPGAAATKGTGDAGRNVMDAERRPVMEAERRPKTQPAATPGSTVSASAQVQQQAPPASQASSQAPRAGDAVAIPASAVGKDRIRAPKEKAAKPEPTPAPKVGARLRARLSAELQGEPLGRAETQQNQLRRHFEGVQGRLAAAGYRPRPALETPPLPPNARLEQSQELVPGRAVVRLYFDEATHSHVYEVLEPQLLEPERQILAFIRDTLLRTLDGSKALAGQAAAEETLLDGARQAILDHAIVIDEVGMQRVEYYL